MSQSLADVVIHIVFSTKNRVPFLKSPDVREHLEGYMVGALANLDCPSLITRAVDDHIDMAATPSARPTFRSAMRNATPGGNYALSGLQFVGWPRYPGFHPGLSNVAPSVLRGGGSPPAPTGPDSIAQGAPERHR